MQPNTTNRTKSNFNTSIRIPKNSKVSRRSPPARNLGRFYENKPRVLNMNEMSSNDLLRQMIDAPENWKHVTNAYNGYNKGKLSTFGKGHLLYKSHLNNQKIKRSTNNSKLKNRKSNSPSVKHKRRSIHL